MKPFKRRNILGCPFDAITFDETVEAVRSAILTGKRLQIVPANVDFVVKARRDPAFAAALERADLVVADGVPVVWAARALHTPLRGRVSGTDLVMSCAAISQELGWPVALIGAAPGVAARAADQMRQEYPKAAITAFPTPFPLTESANKALVEEIRRGGAKIVLAALGAPRQEEWVFRHLAACGGSVGIGVGSAFDIISGDRPRAPQWMCDNGLEWLYRMWLEPRRLGRRYLIEDSRFVPALAGAVLRSRLRNASVRESA